MKIFVWFSNHLKPEIYFSKWPKVQWWYWDVLLWCECVWESPPQCCYTNRCCDICLAHVQFDTEGDVFAHEWWTTCQRCTVVWIELTSLDVRTLWKNILLASILSSVFTPANLYALLWWIRTIEVVYFGYCGGIFCVLWWIRTTVVVYVAYCGGVFFRTVVDNHYCCGLLCLMWWSFLHTVVDKHYCGGLLCLMW